jgi:hypothetical protein
MALPVWSPRELPASDMGPEKRPIDTEEHMRVVDLTAVARFVRMNWSLKRMANR